ncbi:MAG: hypothetical protein JW763_06630 [candidate division Zixibacteria bacterium]|nr:hypothetical protein [candidate division Zixibacteria bacterium]
MEVGAVSSAGIMYSPTVTAAETAPEKETIAVPVTVEKDVDVADENLVIGDEYIPSDILTEDGARKDGCRCGHDWHHLRRGHFRGMADIRHRMKYAERIAEMRQQKAAEMAEEGVENILEATSDQISTLIETGGLDEATVGAINESTGAFALAMFELADSYDGDSTALAESLQANFDSLIAGLQAALHPSADVEGEEPIVVDPVEAIVVETEGVSISDTTMDATIAVTSQEAATDVVDEDIPSVENPSVEDPSVSEPAANETETTGFEEFFTQLSATFESALSDLVESLDNVRVLPEMHSPHHGHGRAFFRFMAMYEQMMANMFSTAGTSLDAEG